MLKWLIVACAFFVAAWFVYDGTHALVSGDYVTPRSGDRAGQLGPWSGIVSKAGIEPRSPTMKLIFVCFGVAWLFTIACYVLQFSWAWGAMICMAILSLWYLPFGTVLGLVQIVLLIITRTRS